jgi:hypothetical protein
MTSSVEPHGMPRKANSRRSKGQLDYTILQAMDDPQLFGGWFEGPSWQPWRVFLGALFGLELTPQQMEIWTSCTGRTVAQGPYREAWLAVGRRGGKSRILALIAIYLSCFRSHDEYLSKGEIGTVMVLASTKDQARTIMAYIAEMLRVPLLKSLVVKELAESFELSNRVRIEVSPSNYKSVRGYTLIACLLDEVAFWRSEDSSSSPDYEVLRALRPGMLTVKTSMLLAASSPYAKRGELWKNYQKHFGRDESATLVWQGSTLKMNQQADKAIIDAETERDPEAASAEYGAQFRSDIQSLFAIEQVKACISPGVRERPPERDSRYHGFVDPSGGSSDSMSLAISHKSGSTNILNVLREWRPPFNPESVCAEIADVCARYRVFVVTGDRYAGAWVAERFRAHRLYYRPADLTKSELYLELVSLINSRAVDLLDNDRLVHQLVGLERRTTRSGKDSIDHEPNAHDDLANAAAGAAWLAHTRPSGWSRKPFRFSPDIRPSSSSNSGGWGEKGVGWLAQ